MRTITKTYQDPLEVIWIRTAEWLGIRIERDPAVFASWDGCGLLRIGVRESLDADDSLAQMIFHELCHALVEGPEAFHLPDWGLENDRPEHDVREHACLRLQAALAGAYGLRELLGATTEYRSYYDALPADPLAPGDDPATALAAAAWRRARSGPLAGPLAEALAATSRIAAALAGIAPPDSLWSAAGPAAPAAPLLI